MWKNSKEWKEMASVRAFLSIDVIMNMRVRLDSIFRHENWGFHSFIKVFSNYDLEQVRRNGHFEARRFVLWQIFCHIFTVQWNSAIYGCQGTNRFCLLFADFLLLILEIKRNNRKGILLNVSYWRISVTHGSGIARFNCTDSTRVEKTEFSAKREGGGRWWRR